MRCQHNHHRPRVYKHPNRWLSVWRAKCETCGWGCQAGSWSMALMFALAHSEELTS